MADKLEFRFDLLKGQTTIIEALDEASKKATGFKAVLGDVNDSGTSFFKLSAAVAAGQAAFELAKKAVSAFTGIIKEGIDAAIEKENAVNRLNLSLAQTGKYSESASADLQAYAEEIRKTTRYTDDQILSNAAYLQSLTYLDVKGLKQATTASANLAATLGIDLSSATSLVAKSIEGNTGALSRYGIQVKKGATETENFNNTIRALSQFAGRAAADANTFGGSLVKMSNSMGEVYESLGMIVTQNPLFITLINKLSDAFNDLSGYISENQNDIIKFINGALKLLGEAVLKIAPVFEFIMKTMNGMLGVIRLSVQGWAQLLDMMSGLQVITEIIGRFITALLEIPKGLAMLVQYIAELASSSTLISKAFDKAGISVDKVSQNYSDLINKVEDLQVNVASVDFDESTVKALDNMDSLLGKSQDFLTNQQDAVSKIGNEIIKVSEVSLDNQKARIKNNEAIIFEADNFFERMGKAFGSFSIISSKLSEIFTKIDRSTGLTQFEQLLDSLGPTLVSGISKGADGARQMLTGAVKGIGNLIAPGMGEALGPIFDMFAQGPEQTKKMVKEFYNAIPVIVQNIVDSIPAFIEAWSESMPDVAVKLAMTFSTPGFYLKLAAGLLKAFAGIPGNMSKAILNGLKDLPNQFTTGFLKGIPSIIAKFIEGAASFTSYILQGAVKFLQYIVEGAARFVFEIVEGAGSFVISILSGAASFVGQIISGAVNFVGELISGAGRFIDELISKISGGVLGGGSSGIPVVGSVIDEVSSWFSKGGLVKPIYAQEGRMIPNFQSRGSDTVPSMLTPGEYVVDRSLTKRLTNYLDNQDQSNSNVLLSQILGELKKPQTMNSEITINRKTFADLILELNRSNARMA